jgi:hypothetical protein
MRSSTPMLAALVLLGAALSPQRALSHPTCEESVCRCDSFHAAAQKHTVYHPTAFTCTLRLRNMKPYEGDCYNYCVHQQKYDSLR